MFDKDWAGFLSSGQGYVFSWAATALNTHEKVFQLFDNLFLLFLRVSTYTETFFSDFISHIDIMGLFKSKTKGNLDVLEQSL